MRKRINYRWPFIISMLIFIVVFFISSHAKSQFKRDESTAEEFEKVNLLTPTAKAAGVILDNTINQVLPFDLSTESALVQYERDCYVSCAQNRQEELRRSVSDFDRGQAWSTFHNCKDLCPYEAAYKTELRGRAPAGSALENIRIR